MCSVYFFFFVPDTTSISYATGLQHWLKTVETATFIFVKAICGAPQFNTRSQGVPDSPNKNKIKNYHPVCFDVPRIKLVTYHVVQCKYVCCRTTI